jgi:hypothetical protein
MRLKGSREHYGKIFLIVATGLIWLLILVLFKIYGYEKTWQLWKVPTEMPPFLDFRLIPGSAESFLRGFEPTLKNPFDPRERLFNYPMFWRLFFYSGVTQADAIWIGTGMIVLFFIGVFLFPQHLRIDTAAWMLLVAFSPAAMLLYERGNVDLIVFALCIVIVLAGSYSVYLATLLLMAGTIVKLYPFFGISILLKESRAKFLWLSAACLVVLVLYVAVTWESISSAWNLTARGKFISYGAYVFFYRYEESFSRYLAQWFPDSQVNLILKLGPIVLAFLFILVAGILALRNPGFPQASSERNLSAFRMGASIYIGTFLLGNNWDYRLAFLILVIPQLLEWTRSRSGAHPYIARLMVFAVIASCWHFLIWYSPHLTFSPGSQEVLFVIDEFMNWMLVPGFAYLLFASFPNWARELAGYFPGRNHIRPLDENGARPVLDFEI